MNKGVIPFSLKDAPSLIEHLLPVQKISAEAYKEQMAGSGKTLAPLGSYWKGRKPLILNRACILGSLLPSTSNAARDLEVFELLMGMDDISIKRRLGIPPSEKLPIVPYRELVSEAKRAEEIGESLHEHIWPIVNQHLGTQANCITALVEQLGIMRFGHRPKLADTFCGSGQIVFEAARLGCDVYASDLNPIACLLTWAAFNIVGAPTERLEEIKLVQLKTIERVSKIIDELDIERDGKGYRAKVFLYCIEVVCPQTGWLVPVLPSFIISKQRTGDKFNAVAVLVPDPKHKRYDIKIKTKVSDTELEEASRGTVRNDGRGQDPYMVHTVDGREYRIKIGTLRGDYTSSDGSTKNKLRQWTVSDFTPAPDDIYQERLYAVQWLKEVEGGRGEKYEFREVTTDDLKREQKVIQYVEDHLKEWQEKGYLPDMKIESGYNTDQPIRERGWTHWHHLFNPRQLLIAGLVNQFVQDGVSTLGLTQILNWNSRLAGWNFGSGGGGSVQQTFYNQALNTFFNYGARSFDQCIRFLEADFKSFPFRNDQQLSIKSAPANEFTENADIFITDPPYGDAVKYEEILDFFVSWLQRKHSTEFKHWTWDSRKFLAITGEGEDFRKRMVAAYSKMTEQMADNGIQVIMFTHQSGSIWADMANIVWASGLQVTAAWYVVTETDSAMREGSYVKGTVLLILRKRKGSLKISRDDLAWEIQEEVEKQVRDLTGLNQTVRASNRDENVFEDADIQMAGYAAALRTLTRYSIIDGRDMPSEAIRPRVKGEITFVDTLIEFAVATANQALVPAGIAKPFWDKLSPPERFILKMLDIEAKGGKTLDNYQNFAKAFKVHDFQAFMASKKANEARLKTAVEFGRLEMSEGSELFQSTLRAVFYAVMELTKEIDSNDVIQHLSFNVKDYLASAQQRELVIALADYLASKTENTRSEEASAARVLKELVKNQKLG